MRVESLSVVIPFFNEAENIAALFDRLVPVLETVAENWAVLCVDDGSVDETLARLQALRRQHPGIRVIKLSRNFGKEAAISAGLAHALGAHVLIMDGDLQHPPELIPDMLKRQREGADIVYGLRRSRATESFLRGALSRLYYGLFSRLSDVPMAPEASDFRLMSGRVVAALNALPEKTRFMKGLYAWVGFSHEPCLYEVAPRRSGASKWSLRRLCGYAWNGIVSFSVVPLRFWTVIGSGIAALSLFYAGWIGLTTLVFGREVPGYATLAVAIFFLGGLQLLSIGVLGEYIARIFTETKNRPLFIIEETHGFDDGSD
ncbi:MAG: glycosyltransferase family 2 protein [Henriciella sp.]